MRTDQTKCQNLPTIVSHMFSPSRLVSCICRPNQMDFLLFAKESKQPAFSKICKNKGFLSTIAPCSRTETDKFKFRPNLAFIMQPQKIWLYNNTFLSVKTIHTLVSAGLHKMSCHFRSYYLQLGVVFSQHCQLI